MPPPSPHPDAGRLAALLARHSATAALVLGLEPSDIAPLREKGVAHAHFRLGASGFVLRVPRLSHPSTDGAAGLAYQAECFRRAEPSGATPRLRAILPAEEMLPGGALLVEEVVGRPPQLPNELPKLADALVRLHTLPVPAAGERAPLLDHAKDPLGATLAVIERNVPFFAEAKIQRPTRQALEEELDWARCFGATARGADHPICLVGTDTHPGNFLVRADGRAIFVDLEKALYGSPAIDLAHASLLTSTRWDPDVDTVLTPSAIAHFYRHYLDRIGTAAAARLRPWLAPSRRLTWLRTMMWCTTWLPLEGKRLGGSQQRVPDYLRRQV
ncbi:MAG: phosphotransferase, partial [Alphaproteobacteria bacterium]|nr:phosphotransferase [Alphaproteobacteria bacterium]